jgi:rhodanese-related sulfurtransferase
MTKVNLTRRGMLFKIARLITTRLIKGEYYVSQVNEISADDLLDRIKSKHDPLLIDVRSTQEFNSGFGHIPNSKLIPLFEIVPGFASADEFKKKVNFFEALFKEIEAYKDHEVVTICPGGGFSLVAAEIMTEAGFKDVKSLSGGADGWFKKGYPTRLS